MAHRNTGAPTAGAGRREALGRLVRVVVVVAGLLAGGHVAAQPPASVSPLWHVAGMGSGTPTHDGDTAYFLTVDREVAAVNIATGAVRWKTTTGVRSHDSIFGTATAGTALSLSGDVVVAGDWDVVGFDRVTGVRRWVYEAPEGDGPGLFLGPARGNTVYAGSPGGKVYAIDTATGRLRWMTTVVDGRMTSIFRPVVHERELVVSYSTYVNPSVGGLARLDPDTGRLRWRAEFPKAREPWQHTNASGAPVVIDDLAIGSAGDGNIYAYDLASGTLRWTLPRLTGPFEGTIVATDMDFRAITATGRLVVAGSATGYVVAYDIDTQQEKWRFVDRLSGSTTFALAADEQRVYVPFFGGFIVALDLATGAERWRYGDFTKGLIWPPDPAGDRVFASASRAGFFALPTNTSEPNP